MVIAISRLIERLKIEHAAQVLGGSEGKPMRRSYPYQGNGWAVNVCFILGFAGVVECLFFAGHVAGE